MTPSIDTKKTTDLHTSPTLSNNSSAAGVKRKRTSERKFYAVKIGKSPGVYETWNECLSQVKGHKGAVFKAFPSSNEANAFVQGRASHNPNQTSAPKFYAVQNGRSPGVYTSWPAAQAQISDFKNPKHKSFATRAEAEAFVNAGRKQFGHDFKANLSSEEQEQRQMIRKSAPGLVLNGTYTPKDREGNVYELGRAPLPPGAEDGFDPNIRLNADGTIVNKTEAEKSKTKDIPRSTNPPGMLRIYTDGSSLKNGQAGARAGVGVYFGPEDPQNVSEALKGTKQTNQRAELTAILRALDIAPRHREVTIYTDSKYSIDCVTNWYKNWQRNNWTNTKGKPVENKDLITEIRERIEERDLLKNNTYFVWVKGHANDAGNVAADRLAVEGAMHGHENSNETRYEEQEDNEGHGAQDDSAENSDGNDEVKQAYRDMKEAMADDKDDEIE